MSANEPCPKQVQILREKIADCPEDLGHVLGWILTIGSSAQAIGMRSGPIEPWPAPTDTTPRMYLVRILPDCPEMGAEYVSPSRRITASHEDAERFTEAEAYAVAHERRARFPRGRCRCMVEHIDQPGPALSWDDYEHELFDTPGPWPLAVPGGGPPKQGELFTGAVR
jgi:hypothetical protein